jgi:hypothetical protein
MKSIGSAQDLALYYEANRAPLEGITGRMDELLDGRLPRVVAVQAYGQTEAKLIEGAITPERARSHELAWNGIRLNDEQAVAQAAIWNKYHRSLADIMITAAAGIANVQTDAAKLDRFRWGEEVGDPSLEASYAFGTCRRTKLRIEGGRLAVCTAATLEDREDSKGAFYKLQIDDWPARYVLDVLIGRTDLFMAKFDMEASDEIGLLRTITESAEATPTINNVLSQEADSNIELAERINDYMKAQRAAGVEWAADPGAGWIALALYRQGARVRQIRERDTLKLHEQTLPKPVVLRQLANWLGVRSPTKPA